MSDISFSIMSDISFNYQQHEIDKKLENIMSFGNKIHRKWMESELLEHNRYIIKNEDYNDNMGYIIEYYDKKIYVTFWVFNGDIENEELNEKRIIYNSLDNLYEQSKIFVKSDLINYSLLHKSQYKMMCDFIRYYETKT